MDSLAHPFRFSGGKAVVFDVDSDAIAAQVIASAIKTMPGELLNTPDFGSNPSEFSKIDTAGLTYSITQYHPTIQIDDLYEIVKDSETIIQVSFSRQI